MKLSNLLLPLVLVSALSVSRAQTTAPSFTDEDLKKYAVTMDSIKGMQQTLAAITTEMVQKNTVMSVPRYNELFKIIGDEAKLAETKATPEEIAFVRVVATKRADESTRINSTYKALVTDYVGVKTFNAIKKSLETDQALKAKYDTISKALESKGGE